MYGDDNNLIFNDDIETHRDIQTYRHIDIYKELRTPLTNDGAL